MSKLLSYYGDDFTGSTDVMEVLASQGIKTVLFTRIPSPDEFARFADCVAMGLAGTSRSRSPDWMDENLPEAFTWLKSLGALHCHYKVCSTFDSAPHVGNIAKAAEIGLRIFGQASAPLVIGSPALKRYTFAGHLFAGYQGKVYRIDRHPVMSVHPVTPMDESDVLQHLAQQGKTKFELLDVHDLASQLEAGKILLQRRGFCVGSSGVESALLAAMGQKPVAPFAPIQPVSQMLVISGSVSPTTERQINFALAKGFDPVAADPLDLAQGQIEAALAEARTVLARGKSPLIYSAKGPATDQGAALSAIANGREVMSRTLGQIAKKLISEFKLKRVVIAGGDTSSHALTELGVSALTMRFPLLQTPGSPLCLAHSDRTDLDGLEVALKGGQVGGDDYFVQLQGGLT